MLHLHTERLAALGDDLPTPDEAAHLVVCGECARERASYQTLVAMAHGEREPFGLPLTRWDTIAAELAARHAAVAEIAPTRRARPRLLQIAAGLLLVAGGAAAGRVSVGARPLPGLGSALVARTPPTTLNQSGARPISDSATFESVEDARSAQQRSEATYEQAVAYLARYDTAAVIGGSPVAVRSRLAALDQMISTTREAMRQAPHDPVINGYYLTTLGQREATLRQLNSALPALLRVNSF